MSSRLEALKKYIANAERTFVVGGELDPVFSHALAVKEVLAVLAFGNLSAYKETVKELADSLTEEDLRRAVIHTHG